MSTVIGRHLSRADKRCRFEAFEADKDCDHARISKTELIVDRIELAVERHRLAVAACWIVRRRQHRRFTTETVPSSNLWTRPLEPSQCSGLGRGRLGQQPESRDHHSTILAAYGRFRRRWTAHPDRRCSHHRPRTSPNCPGRCLSYWSRDLTFRGVGSLWGSIGPLARIFHRAVGVGAVVVTVGDVNAVRTRYRSQLSQTPSAVKAAASARRRFASRSSRKPRSRPATTAASKRAK